MNILSHGKIIPESWEGRFNCYRCGCTFELGLEDKSLIGFPSDTYTEGPTVQCPECKTILTLRLNRITMCG